MNKYLAGLIAGFVATVALSIIMVLKASAGLMPALNVPALLGMLSGTGAVGGWIVHFAIGTILWGLLFAALAEHLPGETPLVKGLSFGGGAWILMMVILMPIAGKGLFALNMGLGAPVVTLILHLVYGPVLGLTYGRLARTVASAQASAQNDS